MLVAWSPPRCFGYCQPRAWVGRYECLSCLGGIDAIFFVNAVLVSVRVVPSDTTFFPWGARTGDRRRSDGEQAATLRPRGVRRLSEKNRLTPIRLVYINESSEAYSRYKFVFLDFSLQTTKSDTRLLSTCYVFFIFKKN